MTKQRNNKKIILTTPPFSYDYMMIATDELFTPFYTASSGSIRSVLCEFLLKVNSCTGFLTFFAQIAEHLFRRTYLGGCF